GAAATAFAAAVFAAGAGGNRGCLRPIQLDERFQLLRCEPLNVDADLASVCERDRRLSRLAKLLLPELAVPGMTARFNHLSGFSTQFLKGPLDREHFAIARLRR